MEYRDDEDLQATFDAIAEDEAYRALIVKMLNEGEVALDFTKADGSHRKMRATTNATLIAEAGVSLTEPADEKRVEGPYHQVVFDLDKKAWRCFKWTRLISAAGPSRNAGAVH